MKKPKILFYDIETCLNQAYLFGCGKQVIRHTQLVPSHSTWGIICITYCWNDNKSVKSINWTPEGGTRLIIEEFDKLVKQSDHTIGKNSDRFDVKMINAQRMLAGLPGNPEWVKYTDDLEKQMRRYFRLPSQSLDYISGQLGFGGKIKMEFRDWVNISDYMEIQELGLLIEDINILEIISKQRFKKSYYDVMSVGKKAFNKMVYYGKKDSRDTRSLWYKLSSHFDAKFNMAVFNNDTIACKNCGSLNLQKNGTKISGKMRYQTYACNDCLCYAGRTPLSSKRSVEGRMG